MSDVFYPEQQVAHDNLVKSRGGLLFWKVGTGKTRVGLEVFATLQKVYKWSNPCICLFVCKPKCFHDIRKEIIKIGFECIVLENDYEVPEAVWKNMHTRPTILLVSHAMLSKRLEYLDSNRFIRMVLLDDGYLFKNPRSEKSKAAQRLSVSRRSVLMSGSVMTQRDLTDIYGQAQAVNQHRRIAPNLTKFRSEYFNHMRVGNPDKKQWPMMSPKKGSYERIVKALGDCTNFYFPKNEERKIHHQIVEVPATSEQTAMFEELREWYSIDQLNVELDFVLQVSLRVQQVSNGWVQGEHGEPRVVSNYKVGRTIELVEDILATGERCVIYCAFRHDVKMLVDALPFATLQMLGGQQFDVAAWETGRYPVVVATEASAVGFNHFEQVPYAIYFSMDWPWLYLQQSRGRHDRRASLHREVFYYYMQTQGGLDAKIYDVASSSGEKESTLIRAGEIRSWITNV